MGAPYGGSQHVWDKPTHYYKVQGLDGWWYIAKWYPQGPSVKGGLTSEEADAYLKLLKEQ